MSEQPTIGGEVAATVIQALRAAESWLDRWGQHAGSCAGNSWCTCGLVAITNEAQVALALIDEAGGPDDEGDD